MNESLQTGVMFTFVPAPPRWRGEKPRNPETRIMGKAGVILDGPFPDYHDWGGLYDILCEGKIFQYYGDFMEVMA